MFENPDIIRLIELAINEDIGEGDLTTNAVTSYSEIRKAGFIVKQNGIIAGLEIAKMIFKKLDNEIKWTNLKRDGDACFKGDRIALVEGNYKVLLSAERTALNFLQRMSGVATKTNLFVKKLEGLNTKILDTRKTIPGHRMLDKYAVKTGGGTNHRMGLFDMVMIKDNHIKLAGGITKAVNEVRKKVPGTIKIEVEVSNINEVKEALENQIHFIMLDNMSIREMEEAVKICKGKVFTEASGNINLDNIREIAQTNVDYISVGELTHSAPALDISMKIID